MNFQEIEILVDLISASNVAEVTIRNEGRRLTIRKGAPAPSPAPAQPVVHVAQQAVAIITDPDYSDGVDTSPNTHTINAPMVGIFHHAEPPVAPGTRVEPGRLVGVIESMKLMNDVHAEIGGTVKELVVEAGMAVEYGQPLFVLDD
jgi:acetyl-CoA carboxylase biotin carboxyl carrier protein